ncbi:uncharacterized protein LOC124643200 [Helicoverpa zea]|uniref:uncharacterized protein LOC124643200 n=1 Tax=Helicoverpa zea TaxID=7113 RepID=UPI001F583D2B|nr:uncharacterized protein LOC124643200 [Helicoverpa zea]
MEAFSDLQDDIKAKMLKAKANFKKSPKERLTTSYVETRLDNLEQQWSLFSDTHTKIISQVKRSDLYSSDYHKNAIYDDVEELYVEYKTDLKEMLCKLNSNKQSVVVSGQSSATRFKLPEIKIPMFSGNYTEWQTFRDLFLGLVHENKALDDAQRFYYLRGHLTGEAEQLLRNIKMSSDSYQIAWEKLDSMYNNKRFLANGILKRLLSQKNLVSESATEIKKLISTTSDCLESIKNLGIDVSSWDILIIHIISIKLDKDTRKAWELKVASEPSDDLPTFVQFSEFLTGRFRGLENIETKLNNSDKKVTKSFHIVKKNADHTASCLYCSEDHKIYLCKKFGKETNDARRNFALENKLCFVCLLNNHSAKACRNTLRCQVCKRRHHTLLHPTGVSGSGVGEINNNAREEASSSAGRSVKEDTNKNSSEITVQAEGSSKPIVSCLSTGRGQRTVLLTTALVKAESKEGNYQVIRALLDQGSQGSFVTESTVQYLGLKKKPSRHTVLGVGGEKSVTSKFTVDIKLRSRIDPNFQVGVNAYVLKSVTALLPATRVARIEWIDLTEDDLADPEYHKPNKIDILLGAEVYSQIIQEGIKRNITGTLLAQDTSFGWILSGSCEVDPESNVHSHIAVMHSSVQADDMLKRFWELEAEPSGTKKILTEDEIKCEKIFTATTKRNSMGRYIVKLPLRDSDPVSKVGESKCIAEKRLKSLETRLKKNRTLREDYAKVMQEYLDLKHMRKITEKEKDNSKAIYLPHHAVIREDKETTKVRVVFDASCKGTMGMSLNDNLLIGPTLQAELRHTIMRWRTHPICLVSDVIKMYRAVLLDNSDTMYQRILWRDDPGKEIEEYELMTVTFGTASAPYLAVRALHQVAYDECKDKPQVEKIILNDFYMDDLMTGADTTEEGYKIYIEMNEVLAKGGFYLQKWRSNSKALLDKIREGKCTTDDELKIKTDEVTKILGLTWNSCDDVFQYAVKLLTVTAPITKRKIIAEIARLFDPLGWLAPSIVLAKIFIQKLWLAGLEWDQEIPNNLVQEWATYHRNLPFLGEVRIPRWLHIVANVKQELHGFSDASKMAYAAVIYLRVIDDEGKINISLVTSKTKVAPIRQVSIPRLELCGAVLLAKLMAEVGDVMGIQKCDWHAWTDSEVVLAWLNSHPSRWKTFVANRASDILNIVDTYHWSHVSSKENPADCASRGVCPSELKSTAIWWNGPDLLRQEVIEYKRPKHLATHLEEVKVHTTALDTITIWNKFSKLSKLIRVIAYCKRFLNLRKNATNKHSTKELTKQELDDATNTCIKRCQEDFSEELKESKNSKKKGNLKSLNSFIDSDGIIRVGGRLDMSQLDQNRVHPILLPKESFLSQLLVADAHAKTMHGGPQLMVTYLRSKYWIIGVKLLAKKYVRNCVTCIRYAAKTRTQLMGQLPSARVTPNKPFLCTGVDYAGPINIRVSKGRGNKSYKGYIALFICMSTRAVHIEVVSELSTKGFLAAYKRFVARRGRCAELYSDNGTNFVGAARELLVLYNAEKSNFNAELAEYLATNGTEWHFIPPHAPNFGGLWEAGIKSTKYHLKRIIGNTTLTYEEMATVLAQVEACLNSRPLSYVEDEDKVDILTPAHFLIGEPAVLVPDSNYEKANISSLQRWQLQQRMMQEFWRRWSHDYLHQFLQRRKWAHQIPEPSVGTVVLVKEDDMPPGKWLLGRIEQKHCGPDGIARVVTLRTKASIIKRPVSKLCVLPMAK